MIKQLATAFCVGAVLLGSGTAAFAEENKTDSNTTAIDQKADKAEDQSLTGVSEEKKEEKTEDKTADKAEKAELKDEAKEEAKTDTMADKKEEKLPEAGFSTTAALAGAVAASAGLVLARKKAKN